MAYPGTIEAGVFGQLGGAHVATSGSATIPSGKVIVAITSLHNDTTLTATAESGFPDPPDTQTIPAGTTIDGRFTAITVGGTNGAAICYFG